MNNFLNLFLSGTVVSLPSIIAAAGILINNSRASSRQKSDRSIKMKLELLEGIYSNFDDISDKFVLTMSSIEKRLFNIQEEVLENASDNELQRYVLEMNELAKESIFLAVHKRKILDTYKIKIDADELAKYVVEVTKRIITCADMIVFVTKLYVVKYYETADKSLATQAVIQELKKEKERGELYNQYKDVFDVYMQDMENPRRNLIKEYDSFLVTFDDKEKSSICSSVSLVTKAYIDELNKYGAEPFDQFEDQLVKAINKLVK